MGAVVDDEEELAEAMWGGDIEWSPKVRGQIEERTESFAQAAVLRGAIVALCIKHESQETYFT
jgi:hypothetical protein